MREEECKEGKKNVQKGMRDEECREGNEGERV